MDDLDKQIEPLKIGELDCKDYFDVDKINKVYNTVEDFQIDGEWVTCQCQYIGLKSERNKDGSFNSKDLDRFLSLCKKIINDKEIGFVGALCPPVYMNLMDTDSSRKVILFLFYPCLAWDIERLREKYPYIFYKEGEIPNKL